MTTDDTAREMQAFGCMAHGGCMEHGRVNWLTNERCKKPVYRVYEVRGPPCFLRGKFFYRGYCREHSEAALRVREWGEITYGKEWADKRWL